MRESRSLAVVEEGSVVTEFAIVVYHIDLLDENKEQKKGRSLERPFRKVGGTAEL